MAKFVPFILKTDDDQKIGVKITRMKKADAAQTEKEPVWANKLDVCLYPKGCF